MNQARIDAFFKRAAPQQEQHASASGHLLSSPAQSAAVLAPSSTEMIDLTSDEVRPTSRGLRTEGAPSSITALIADELVPATQQGIPTTLKELRGIQAPPVVAGVPTPSLLVDEMADMADDLVMMGGGVEEELVVPSTSALILAAQQPSVLATTSQPAPAAQTTTTAAATVGTLGSLGSKRTVFLPWDARHRYRAPNGRQVSHWDRVTTILGEAKGTITTAGGLVQLIRSVQPDPALAGSLQLNTLAATLDAYLPATLSHKFLTVTVPWMIGVLEDAATTFAGMPSIPILQQGFAGSVRMTQPQAATLLACGFFCVMPYRYHPTGTNGSRGVPPSPYSGGSRSQGHGSNLPAFNFNGLFGASYAQSERRPQAPLYGKIACLINYFITMCDTWDAVVKNGLQIEISRVVKSKGELAAAFASGADNQLPALTVSSTLLIEDAHQQLQADFANQMLGGGVLGRGCVQEEIRMVVSPELLIGLLVCEPLLSREAVLMSGCAQYSTYTGYAREFAFSGSAVVPPPTEHERSVTHMRNIMVVAFDAYNYNAGASRPSMQYEKQYLTAEVEKALVAFSPPTALSTILTAVAEASGPSGAASVPIATGHWGCGAFGGDRELKFLIQLLAASYAARRPITYCCFGDTAFADRCTAIHKHLTAHKITAGQLLKVVTDYPSRKGAYGVGSIFDFLLC